MRLRKIYSEIIPFKGYIAMTLFPFIFIRKENAERFTATVEAHESIHALQQTETLWIFFMLLYGLEMLVKYLITLDADRAYLSISFEQEAYDNQGKPDHIAHRRHYAWVKYVFKLYKI